MNPTRFNPRGIEIKGDPGILNGVDCRRVGRLIAGLDVDPILGVPTIAEKEIAITVGRKVAKAAAQGYGPEHTAQYARKLVTELALARG